MQHQTIVANSKQHTYSVYLMRLSKQKNLEKKKTLLYILVCLKEQSLKKAKVLKRTNLLFFLVDF